MLIRLCDHFKDNPKRIDKLIAVKGLPPEWFFRETAEGRELKKPWEPDVDSNIPTEIRHLCEPMYILRRFAPINSQAKEVLEKRQILGVRIDYNSEPGRQMWDDVERFIEESMPRNERIPVPVLCARDERAGFETYTPRRTTRGSLELVPSTVPSVDLTQYAVTGPKPAAELISPEPPVSPSPTPLAKPAEAQGVLFKCESCDYAHRSKAGVRMHTMKRHPVQEKAVIS